MKKEVVEAKEEKKIDDNPAQSKSANERTRENPMMRSIVQFN